MSPPAPHEVSEGGRPHRHTLVRAGESLQPHGENPSRTGNGVISGTLVKSD